MERMTKHIMYWVYASAVPAIVLFTLWQGMMFLVHLGVATFSGMCFEALVLKMRHKPMKPAWTDGTVMLTALLLTAGVPALAPWWITVIGMFFAIVVAKQLYGGLGHNIFNPAMVGYAVLLIALPQFMVVWAGVDTITQATPLDIVKSRTFSLFLDRQIDYIFLINEAFMLGGFYLIYKRIIDWRIPFAFLSAIFLTSLGLTLIHPGLALPPLFQLIFGATMIGAFYIATDPVTISTTKAGRVICALLAGFLVVMFRSFSSYPDGVAFAILIMNACTPLIDQWTEA